MAGGTDDSSSTNADAVPFAEILGIAMSRRQVVIGASISAAAFLGAGALFARSSTAQGAVLGTWAAVPATDADTISIPKAHTKQAFLAWGDPIVPSGPAFNQDATNSSTDQQVQLGMGHDGMHYFAMPTNGSEHGLLVINHETLVVRHLFPDGAANWTAEKTAKAQAALGVSVVEITKGPFGGWSSVESTYARRITATTPCALTGPAAGHRLMQTAADPQGRTVLGIIGQCGNGFTPWGTYLTTEENFQVYFHETTLGAAPTITEEQQAINARYGISATGGGAGWANTDERFRADLHPNEPNRFGWIVEIDPFDPTSLPTKRTALGRFRHEGAAFSTSGAGQAVVYMGDDQQFNYIYKFVSTNAWAGQAGLAASPFDDGTLYAARFDSDGTGEWLALVHGIGPLTAANGFEDQGDVVVKTRLAADLVGATPMDRPEWTAVHPSTKDVFCSLTGNVRRDTADAANPRAPNRWGHIITWREPDPAAETFSWDIFALGGPGAADSEFGSPDGLTIDPNGRMWIRTDGGQPGGSNNQMLVADPATAAMKRFMIGPVGAELTGFAHTPDGSTIFVNVQHPGVGGPATNPTARSTWPDGPDAGRPRPATVAIQRTDGGIVGT